MKEVFEFKCAPVTHKRPSNEREGKILICVSNLSYSVPQKNLYDKVSFQLGPGQHCALIGASGSGKSTLTELIINPEKYLFDGAIDIEPGCSIGYVSQFLQTASADAPTVFQYIASRFVELQNEVEALCLKMETASELEELLDQYQQALEAQAAIDGDNFESNINRKLSLASLDRVRDLPITKLSGGEFKLIQVIKEMLIHPDLIMMDEPDAFLDFDNLEALRKLINAHKGTLLVVTHNRFLLNHCFNKILNLENEKLFEFEGGYVAYHFSLLQRKIEQQELAMADTVELERNERLVEKLRFIATNNSEAARGKALYARVRHTERLEARRNKAPFLETKQPEIRLRAEQVLEEALILKVSDLTMGFEQTLFENVSFELHAKDKVALIGANGAGKTTLLREIYMRSNPAVALRENTSVAYLTQNQSDMLDESQTILEAFFDAGFESSEDIRAYVADYGFNEEAAGQKISTLSGGEKNLLQLALVALRGADLLLLDEPTSHMDTATQLALEQALNSYDGAILMISHDFYTIVNCMDYVLILEDQTLRKVSMRKFRKMIYADHFEHHYLDREQKKKTLELQITQALKAQNLVRAKSLAEELEKLIR